MPDIDARIWRRYRDRGVLVFGLHGGESPELLAAFAQQTGVSFPLVRDTGTLGAFAFPAGVGYPYPRDIVVGKDLVVRSIKNSFNASEMDDLVRRLLDESVGSSGERSRVTVCLPAGR